MLVPNNDTLSCKTSAQKTNSTPSPGYSDEPKVPTYQERKKEINAMLAEMRASNRSCSWLVDQTLRRYPNRTSAVMLEKLSLDGAVRIDSLKPGPEALIFGGIHGNEPCGVHAIINLLADVCAGNVSIHAGRVTMVICNREALLEDKRYVKQNLNRLFSDDNHGSDYEARRARELMSAIGQSTHFLDLHSVSSESEPFLMCERSFIDTARQLGAKNIVVGWCTLGDTSVAGDTESFAHSLNRDGKIQILPYTMECGKHDDPLSLDVASKTARAFLTSIGVMPGTIEISSQQSVFELQHVQVREDVDFRFVRNFKNFARLKAGEVIGTGGGKEYKAPYDCVLVLPGPDTTKVGEDQYFIAKEI